MNSEVEMFFDMSRYSCYVAPGVTDMRRGDLFLSRLVRDSMEMDPTSRSMFLFCSRNRKTLCVLVWDNGFWLMKKRIVLGIFAWPRDGSEALLITLEDVRRLVRGDDVFRKILSIPEGAVI